MSYRRPKKDKDYTQKIIIQKTTITRQIDKEEEPNNYNEDELNDVIKAFEYFDINHSGKIKFLELKKVLSSFGNTMTEDEIYNIFRSAGIEDDNQDIDYMKFIDFWIGNN